MLDKKKEEQSQEKRTIRRIIASAQHSFAQQGLPNVTLEEIAEKIGMPNEIIFSYFKNKEALIETIVQEHLESIKLHLTPKKQTQTLYLLLSTLNEKAIVDKEETTFLPIYSEAFLPYLPSSTLKYEYRNFFNELYEFFVADIEQRIAIGELNEEIDITTLASMLVSMLDGAVLNKGFFTEESFNLELLTKQKLIILYYQLVHWHFKIKSHALQSIRKVENFTASNYQKVKYTIMLYAKKKHQIKLRHG